MKNIKNEKSIKKIKAYLEVFYEDLLVGLSSDYRHHCDLENHILSCKLEQFLHLGKRSKFYGEEIKFIIENMRMIDIENQKLYMDFLYIYDEEVFNYMMEQSIAELKEEDEMLAWMDLQAI